MIVIYTQDTTYIRNDAATARRVLLKVYGEKLGEEAYRTINKARVGTAFRKNGGPLVRVVSKKDATEIRVKEVAIGMMQEVEL